MQDQIAEVLTRAIRASLQAGQSAGSGRFSRARRIRSQIGDNLPCVIR
jgi:hypothetical protein